MPVCMIVGGNTASLALDPGRPNALLAMGQLLRDCGEFQEAERCLTAALEGAPAAFQQLAEIRRMTEIDRPLIDRMRAVVGRPDLSVMERVAVHDQTPRSICKKSSG